MKIKFAGEAYEAFQDCVRRMADYTAEMTPLTGEKRDVQVVGPDIQAEWGDAVLYREVNEVSEPYGPVKSERVKKLYVY